MDNIKDYYFSLIIPTYKRQQMLVELLQSIEKNIKYINKIEIIVVDDGSPNADKKEEYVRSKIKNLPFKYIHQKNSGPAKARNHGVSLSKGDYVAFLDDDVEITENWAEEIINGYTDDKIAGIAGYTKEFQAITFVEKFLAFVEHLHKHQFNADKTLAYICTANCSFRKSAFEKVGGFSEVFHLPAGDDMDLGFKLKRAGYEFVYKPKAIVLHKHRSTFFQMLKLFFISGRGAYRCAILHREYNKGHVTSSNINEFKKVVLTLKKYFEQIIINFKNPNLSFAEAICFPNFEILNHISYQLGRIYEHFFIRKTNIH